MKTAKRTLPKKIRLLVLVVLLFVFFASCGTNSSDKIAFSFKGREWSYKESDDYVYWVSYKNDNPPALTDYISSYNKNGKRNWEIQTPYHGEIFPLKDGRFFYADSKGHVCAYNVHGKLMWETTIDFEEFQNSNYFLGENEELIINLLSSPSDSTIYCSINMDGEKNVSPEIQNLATCFTHHYPLGGYIAEGYNGENKWVINRLNNDFTIQWTYYSGRQNLYIEDIDQDGRILFTNNELGGNDYLGELDAEGHLINEIAFSDRITAAYFQDNVVACADKLRVLNRDFSIRAEFDDTWKYPRIKALEDTFFVYSPGSYESGAAVIYDGYCKQYDENIKLIFDKVFEESDRFLEIGENGRLYYRK